MVFWYAPCNNLVTHYLILLHRCLKTKKHSPCAEQRGGDFAVVVVLSPVRPSFVSCQSFISLFCRQGRQTVPFTSKKVSIIPWYIFSLFLTLIGHLKDECKGLYTSLATLLPVMQHVDRVNVLKVHKGSVIWMKPRPSRWPMKSAWWPVKGSQGTQQGEGVGTEGVKEKERAKKRRGVQNCKLTQKAIFFQSFRSLEKKKSFFFSFS